MFYHVRSNRWIKKNQRRHSGQLHLIKYLLFFFIFCVFTILTLSAHLALYFTLNPTMNRSLFISVSTLLIKMLAESIDYFMSSENLITAIEVGSREVRYVAFFVTRFIARKSNSTENGRSHLFGEIL